MSHRLPVLVSLAVLLSAPAARAELRNLQAANDATWVYYQFQYDGAPAFARVYLDTDRRLGTGFAGGGVGADYLLENGILYRHGGGGWNWDPVGPVAHTNRGRTARWQVARADLGEAANPNSAEVLFQVESPLETSSTLTHRYTGGPTRTVTYADTAADFANPERGLYHFTGQCDQDAFSVKTLRQYRTAQAISLVMCVFYLEDFRASPISASALAFFQQQMNTVRAAGLKTVLRFAYTQSTSGNDAPRDRVLAHLDQLAPYLQANQDVIAVVQAGFIGTWGEWYYTQNFGNEGDVSPTDWANRRAVVDKLLAVLPAARMAQLRTPAFKRTFYGKAPLPDGRAYDGSAPARVGHHNDCFLASATDFGTYVDPVVEYPYLAAETRYLAMGGETCAVNPPRSQCATALDELGRFHWSYLNVDYHTSVIAGWQSEGCLPAVRRQLGYRLVLGSGTYPQAATPGGPLTVNLTLRNEGWAAPYNPRKLELVLRRHSGSPTYRFPMADDPRFFLPGPPFTIWHTVLLPRDMPPGDYDLSLSLADPAPMLTARPEYAIRLANSGVWDPATGLNALLHTVTVGP
jgi:hypothetical protein